MSSGAPSVGSAANRPGQKRQNRDREYQRCEPHADHEKQERPDGNGQHTNDAASHLTTLHAVNPRRSVWVSTRVLSIGRGRSMNSMRSLRKATAVCEQLLWGLLCQFDNTQVRFGVKDRGLDQKRDDWFVTMCTPEFGE
jgi:hypothetical protein